MKLTKKDISLLQCLRLNSRMSLTEMSKITKIPISTLFDRLKFQQKNIALKHTTIIDFEKLGYPTRAQIFIKSNVAERPLLEGYLKFHSNVNSIFKSTNRFDFIVEGIFSKVVEVDNFLEELEKKFPSIQHDTHFIVKDIMREKFFNREN